VIPLPFQDPGFQKPFNQLNDLSVCHPLLDQVNQFGVLDVIETTADIALDDPVEFAATLDVTSANANTIHRPSAGSETIRALQEITLSDRFEQHFQKHLDRSVTNNTYSQGTVSAFGFWYPFPSRWGGLVGSAFEFRL
jgi:hypothetical protein